MKYHPTNLIIKTSLTDGNYQILNLRMENQTLLAQARKGGFFSYAAGVAYQILNHYQVGELEIDNYLTDLPVQKDFLPVQLFVC